MKNHTDTDLREALRRKELSREPVEVPDDFLNTIMSEIENDDQPKKTIKLWRYVAAAAAIALLVGIGAIIALQQPYEPITIAEVTEISTITIKIPTQPTVAEAVETQKSEPAKPKKPKPPVKQLPAQQPTVAEQTIRYIAPSKMDDAISRMADYQHAMKEVFECESDNETDVKELMYVFDDNDDFDLMGSLILSACKFDENTSGYFLNYSPQKFFFSVNDEHTGRTYTWIADRVGGKTLLYCANSPQGNGSASDCYFSYFHKMTTKNMNTYTNL